MKVNMRRLFAVLLVVVMLFSNTSVAFARGPGNPPGQGGNSDVYDHIDVRQDGPSITMTYVTKNLVTGEVLDTETVTIDCTVTGITSVSYTQLAGTDDEESWTWTSGFSNDGSGYEFRLMNQSFSKDLTGSSAVIVVDLTDTDGNVYEDVVFTFGPSGCQQAVYDCDGYSSSGGGRGSVGLDFILGVNNDASIVYTDWVIPVTKIWDDDNDRDGVRPESITVELLANGVVVDSSVLNATNNWYYEFTDKEADDANGNLITYTIQEVTVPDGYTASVNNTSFTITNSHELETTSVSGTKTWVDNDDQDNMRPDSVTVELYANGVATGKTATVTAADNWAWTFTDLLKNAGGEPIVYTVLEQEVPGYTASYDGMNVTNTHNPIKIELTVTKNWDDNNNQDGIRPDSVEVELYANGEATGKTITITGDDWTGTFTDLDMYADGEVIEYTVMEQEVEGYESEVDGLTITNVHIPEVTEVSGSKTWDDNNDQDGKRPESITINLLKDDEIIDTATVTAEDGWAWTFTELPKYENEGILIEYVIEEEAVEYYTTVVDGYNVTNTHIPEKTSVTVTKIWDDNDNQDGIRPESVQVELYANGEATGKTITISGDTWTATFNDVDKYANGEEIVYTVVETVVEGYTASYSEDGLTVTNTHVPELTEVSGSKTWNDNNDQDGIRPDSITINLLKDDKVIDTATVTAENGWAWTFTELPKYENEGVLIAYVIEETEVPGYTSVVDGYNVTNSHAPEKTSVTVTKIWDDNDDQDGVRPNEITVELYANGEATGKTLVISGSAWTGTFTDLDKYANGEEIVYTAVEAEVAGYTTSYSEDGLTIINKHNPSLISISGSKTWNDNNDQDGARPASITISLKANGEVVATKTVTSADNWAWTFENVPEFANGERITYTVVEKAVEDYTTTYNGYNVINTHAPAQTSVTVSKIWNDNNNQDGVRANVITVTLLANGVDTGKTLELTEGSGWIGSFTDLPKFEAGKEIVYSIAEVSVEGYTTGITGDQSQGYTITNTHEVETVEVSGKKIWVDADNQDGARPESITINLVKNGEVIASKVVTAADGWAWTFANLPKFENGGQLITYSITENAVEDYTTEYNGYNVINTHAPAKTSVTVTKSWQDSENQDGIRPNDIVVVLLANGKEVQTMTLSAATGWTGSFTDLDKFEGGVEIVYTIQELTVPGYNTSISGDKTTGFTITNSHTPATLEVSGVKNWVDNDDQDGARPESITVHLLADGKVIDTVTVSEADGWAWSFENLPQYRDQGTEIVYSITEDAVEDYTTTYDGHNVTNTHTPEQLSITVSKAWNDNNDQDGIRANGIEVVLLANGEDTGKTLVLNSGNNWTGSFTELDKYEGGVEIDYTIQEIVVSGYTTVITGDKATGFTITNSHNPETVSVSGAKTWIDKDNQDGFRPASITIHLLADGKMIDTVTVTEADGWAWSFENLPKYRDQGTLIEYSVTEDAVEDYSTEYNGFDVTNTHTPHQTSVTVSKQWIDSNDQDGIRSNSITVILLANGESTGKSMTLNSGNNWTGSFTELDKYAAGEEIVYSIQEIEIPGYTTTITGNQQSGFTVTNTHTPETISVSGTKTWIDADNQDGIRPQEITINLLADGEITQTKVVTEADGWAWTFENLPKYKEHGTLIVYSVTEDVVEDYTTQYNNFNVTNTHAPEKTSVTVNKAWADSNNQDGIRPNDITVILLANGEDTGKTLVLSSGNSWTGSFTDLDKYADGVEIKYTVAESTVSGYESVISGNQEDGYTVTNSHTPETVTVSGAKTWVDAENQDGVRPASITINLLADGEIIDTITVSEADDWAWTFENLPKYKNQGVEIVYSITENGVEDYSTEYNAFNVTNTHTPEQTSVTVTKAWVDNDDQDGIRPNDITVILLANGEETDKTLTLNAGNNWTGSFAELDKYADGEEIKYTVVEVSVEGYESVITGSQTNGYIVTNSHNPETVEVSGKKIWLDAGNQDGFRPESITIHLLADGKGIDTITVTEADDWAWSFGNLPKYKNHGNLINYTIIEEIVPGYITTYNGYDVINTHAPEKTSVTVTKAWADSENQDGIRPNDITVTLLANGEPTEQTLILNAGNNWTDSFIGLDKYENGVEIVYTIQEQEIDGYTAVITGSQETGYTITNSHTPETTSFQGSKTWKDHNDQDGFRPESITINLLANGEIVRSVVVTAEDAWSWSFEDLPVYENQGSRIVYSITENAVEDYSTEYDGFNVINTHTPEQTSVTVIKSWQDNNDQDGIRPDEITVILLANGEETGKTLTLDEDGNWTGSFTELDKYADGEQIVYSVSELTVEGYSTVITGDMTVGYTITNSHTPETIAVSGGKTWDDADDQDGARPESITINLMSNGEVIETKVVTEADGWAWTFENLPKYENGGVEIVYAITEEAVEGYTTTYDGYNVTNSYTPAERSLTVTKAWADSDDADGLRPDDITILLYANGELTDMTLTLTAEDNWSGSFVGLPKYEAGVEIVYTIGEVAVEGYNTVIRGEATSGFVVTNSRNVIPQTGDERNLILWVGAMLLSAAVAVYVSMDSKKRKNVR